MISLKSAVPYAARIELRRAARTLKDLFSSRPASVKAVSDKSYAYVVANHKSKLIRDVPLALQTYQENKVTNLELACAEMNGLVIAPGETFSFCHLIGRTSPSRGYKDGLEMHRGELIGAPGGGLCQLANLIFWMALHADVQILERHRHELDLFPDDERTVPFGMGATVFYNYRDLRFRNSLQQPLLVRLSVERPVLKGALLSTEPLPFRVSVSETEHRFVRAPDGAIWRENRVRRRVDYGDGQVRDEELAHNLGKVCYSVSPDQIESAVDP